MAIASINPATGETLRTFDAISDDEIKERIARGDRAFKSYRATKLDERAGWLHAAADILERDKNKWARIMTLEMGKTIASAVAEAEKCAVGCRYYADNAPRFLSDEEIKTNAQRSYVRYEPIGVLLAVMPWNFPFWQVFRFAAPALMAGNVALLKHASNVPQCALAIEEIIREAGFPDDVFQTLLAEAKQVLPILDDARVRGASLTGSEMAGRSVAGEAGNEIKKTVLELGGSDPFIVMASSDFRKAVDTAVTARTINNGQSCIAAKRFIVQDTIADDFEREFVRRMQALAVGDPLDEKTQIGPLATPSIRDGLHKQVEESVSAGARVLLGGKPIAGAGNFYMPTVLTNIPKDSPAYSDELFGPVASLFRVHDAEEAIALANDTSFGLGSAAWTNDPEEQQLFIRELQAGMVFINGMVASDARLPFGGVKNSGYGRELSHHGIMEFVNAKTVWIGGAPETLTE